METLNKLRELLLPVFVLESLDDIPGDASLINDIGADSLDFVEIVYIIEKNFGVKLQTSELIGGGSNEEEIFDSGQLTAKGLNEIKSVFPKSGNRFKEGMTKAEMFSVLTVSDLANIIDMKLNKE